MRAFNFTRGEPSFLRFLRLNTVTVNGDGKEASKNFTGYVKFELAGGWGIKPSEPTSSSYPLPKAVADL